MKNLIQKNLLSSNRRNFLFTSTGVAAATLFAQNSHAQESSSCNANTSLLNSQNWQPIQFEECQSLSPYAMADQSPMIKKAKAYLYMQIQGIHDSNIRETLMDIYENARPTVTMNMPIEQRNALWRTLNEKGYTKETEDNFLPPTNDARKANELFFTATGSGYQSHHAYPGGLATHVANNTYLTNALLQSYITIYDYELNHDIAVAAQLFHDLHKPYVFQWNNDGSTRAENQLAGTGEHHILSTAELIFRRLPAPYIIATICAHTPPNSEKDRAEIVRWIDAASMIANTDPVAYGLLEKKGNELRLVGEPLQEAYICHLADHDFVLSVPAIKNTLPIMKEIAVTDYKISESDLNGKPFNQLRNYIYAQHSGMKIHETYANQGKEAVRKLMLNTVQAA